jgi:hypothetical protein
MASSSSPMSMPDNDQALVRTWVNENAPSMHPVFRAGDFNAQRARPTAPKLKAAEYEMRLAETVSKLTSVSELTQDFCNIVQQYENSLHLKNGREKLTVRGAHTWDEVVLAARDAEANYLADAKKGLQGVVRRFFRVIGDYSSAATPWIGLLPNDSYFSVLCGGLKLVFGVCVTNFRHYLVDGA